MATDGLLHAGRVGAPHGLDGSFHVTRPSPALLNSGAVVLLDGREYKIDRRAGHDSRVIVRLAGIDNRDAANALRGRDLSAPREAAPALGEDEWWAEDLTGCRVVDGERSVGSVNALLGLPSCEVLEVKRPGASDLLVPLVSDAVRSVDVAAKLIDVDLEFLDAD